MGNCYKSGAHRERLPQEDADIPVAIGRNQPLLHEPVVWISDVPLTEGQLRGKRDTFWDTAPVYEGRREIWEALRAAADAAEREDYDLAQAILDGANISIPTGSLTEAYDELGNRYVIPTYCLGPPSNNESFPDTLKHKPSKSMVVDGTPVNIKIRLSTTGEDVKVDVLSNSTVGDLKDKLCTERNIQSQKITMLFSGRILNNGQTISDLKIPKGYVVQAIIA